MLFLYNLIGWEIQLAKEKAEKEGLEKVPFNGRLSWPCLARQVHRWNLEFILYR